MLEHVKNRTVLKADLLPSPNDVKKFYEKYGIPENKAAFISKNFERKVKMLEEFQRGRTISLYKEKKRYQETKHVL